MSSFKSTPVGQVLHVEGMVIQIERDGDGGPSSPFRMWMHYDSFVAKELNTTDGKTARAKALQIAIDRTRKMLEQLEDSKP